MNQTFKFASMLVIALVMVGGCSTAPSSSDGRAELLTEARHTIATFKQDDPTLDRFFTSSVGYAVYPSIGKGGLIVGGAFGRGALFENNQFTAYCDVTQGTIGLQIGGQSYSEIIFFQDRARLDEFRNGAMTFAAQATAVAATYGAGANMDYADGVAVVVGDRKGLMAEASIGGQKFSVIPANDAVFAGDQRVHPNRNEESYDSRANNGQSVYGYADNQDPGWGSDSSYNRQYNVGASTTVRGEVTEVSEFYPARGSQPGRQLTVRADDGRTHTVHLGPVAYLDRDEQYDIRRGDMVTITGSVAQFEGRSVVLARDLVGPGNKRLELRTSDGRSRWNETR